MGSVPLMARITHAFANNELAFLAWDLDVESISGCLGFEITREYLDKDDQFIGSKALGDLACGVSGKGCVRA